MIFRRTLQSLSTRGFSASLRYNLQKQPNKIKIENQNLNLISKRLQSTSSASLNSFIRSTGNLSNEIEIKNIIDLQTNDTLDGSLSLEEITENISKIKVQTANDENYIFCLPKDRQDLIKRTEYDQNQNQNNLVLQIKELFESVNYQNLLQQKLQKIEQEVSQIDQELKPLEEKYQKIILDCQHAADNRLLTFLACWTMSFTSIARLTWWEYSWDIMEPVAWAVQAGGMLFWGWYYFITKNENAMTDLNSRMYNKKFRKRLEDSDFDLVKYNRLVERRRELEKSYDLLMRKGVVV